MSALCESQVPRRDLILQIYVLHVHVIVLSLVQIPGQVLEPAEPAGEAGLAPRVGRGGGCVSPRRAVVRRVLLTLLIGSRSGDCREAFGGDGELSGDEGVRSEGQTEGDDDSEGTVEGEYREV